MIHDDCTLRDTATPSQVGVLRGVLCVHETPCGIRWMRQARDAGGSIRPPGAVPMSGSAR